MLRNNYHCFKKLGNYYKTTVCLGKTPGNGWLPRWLSRAEIQCCYSANMLQHWVVGKGLIYFCKVDHSRISSIFFGIDLVSIIYVRHCRFASRGMTWKKLWRDFEIITYPVVLQFQTSNLFSKQTFKGVHRAYINRCKWCHNHVTLKTQTLKSPPTSCYKWWEDEIDGGCLICIRVWVGGQGVGIIL